QGNRDGGGKFTTASGLIKDVPYTFGSRFDQAAGSNPEELLAAAHAACFTQFMVARMVGEGFNIKEIKTTGTCTVTTYASGHPKITKLKLVTQAKIDNMDNAKFQEFVLDSEKNCPVSGALSAVPLEVEAKLV